jgi:hypothetical protein
MSLYFRVWIGTPSVGMVVSKVLTLANSSL